MQVAVLLPVQCAARAQGRRYSSLVLGGQEGLPLEPGGLWSSPLVLKEQLAADPAMSGAPHQQTSAARFALLAGHEKGLPRLGCPRNGRHECRCVRTAAVLPDGLRGDVCEPSPLRPRSPVPSRLVENRLMFRIIRVPPTLDHFFQ